MENAPRFTLPFRWKLSLIIISVCAVSLLAAIGSFYFLEVLRFHNEIYRRMEATQRLLMENLVTALAKDPTSTNLPLTAMQSEEMIAAAAVYSTDNRLLAKYVRPGSNEFIPLPQRINISFSTDQVVTYHQLRTADGRVLGTLYLKASVAKLASERFGDVSRG